MFIESIRRGTGDTWRFARTRIVSSVAYVVGVFLTASAARYFLFGRQMMIDEWEVAFSGLIGVAAFLALALLWNIACSPYRIERDRRIEAEKKLGHLPERKIGTAYRSFQAEGYDGELVDWQDAAWRLRSEANKSAAGQKLFCGGKTAIIQVKYMLINIIRWAEKGWIDLIVLETNSRIYEVAFARDYLFDETRSAIYYWDNADPFGSRKKVYPFASVAISEADLKKLIAEVKSEEFLNRDGVI
jgi:hypothetical protein